MSLLPTTSVPAASNQIRMLIYSDSQAEQKQSDAQESESKESFPEIPLTNSEIRSTRIKVHPDPLLVRVKPKGFKQPQPSKTSLRGLPYSIHLKIVEYLKYKDIFHLSLICSDFYEKLSVEHMVKDKKYTPEQVWGKFVKNEYPLDYQHCLQKGRSIKSFEDFYKECSLVHHRIKTANFVAFPRLKLPVTVNVGINQHNSIDANGYGIVTLSQANAFPLPPLISLWNMSTGSLIARTNAIVGGPFVLINAIKCNDTEIVYGCGSGYVRFLKIKNNTFDTSDRDVSDRNEKLIKLVRGGSLNVDQPVSSIALGKNWHAYGTLRDRIIVHQRSSEKAIILRGHHGCVDYLEIIDDACIASASWNSSRITVWKTPCHKGNVDWKEEDASSPITLNVSSRNDQPGISCLHWSSPKRLCSGDLQGNIRVWNPFRETEQLLFQFKMHQSPISSIQTMQDLVVSTGKNGRFVVVNEKAQLIQSSAASTTLAKIMENKILTTTSGGDVYISMLSEKPVKVLRRITQNTTAKVACIAFVVIIVGLIVFFSTRDKN